MPTPPAAPVHRTGPASGVRPSRSSASTHSIAVSPAVPISIVWRVESESGTFTNHSDLTRARCA